MNEHTLRQLFDRCADVRIQSHRIGGTADTQPVILLFCEGLADTLQINQFILPRLEQIAHSRKFNPASDIALTMNPFEQQDEVASRVFSGELVFYFAKQEKWYSLDIANTPNRAIEGSNIENTIVGPKDGFIENLQTNIGLIRKRLCTTSLRYEQFKIGKQTGSKVALLYLEDIIRPDLVDQARAGLRAIDIDSLLGTTQINELLSNSSYSIFPLFNSSSRPDYVVDCLVHGRFAILMEGSPVAIIAPVNLTLLLKSPEDIYLPTYLVAFELLVRYAALVISLLLPGFWVALAAYNMEQLPFTLLATLVLTRHGLPLPGPLEAFLMLGLFELFRQASLRLPKAIGQAIAVVGGIVIGDAVIRAGLASSTMLIVSAVTAVATFALVYPALAGVVTVLRFLILLCASFLGMYGFILSSIAIVLYLSKLESFGVPYLSPISPLKPKEFLASLFKKPLRSGNRRPRFIQERDTNPRGGRQ